MFKTLYGKLAAVLLGLLCLLGGFYIFLTLFTTGLFLNEVSQKLNRDLAEHIVADKILMEQGEIHEAALKDLFHMLMVINPNIEVYLLDPSGSLLAYSAPPGKVKRQNVSLEPIQRFLSRDFKFPILGDDPRDPTGRKIFSVSPISKKGNHGQLSQTSNEIPLEGYIYVILGGEEYDSVANMLRGSYFLRMTVWALAASLLIASFSGLLLFNLLTRRLRNLSSVIEAFKHSDFSSLPDQTTPFQDQSHGDEIERLRSNFHQMANLIIDQVGKLKQTDRLRRELVANVSHDLRTPLASLQGYLETLLLKEGKLSPDEHRHYLEIALRHSERLGKLVSELFELAKLDSHETQPHYEAFSPAELVQDVVQKFQLAAQRKKIELRVDYGKDLPFVFADIGLIERVLENLIENALRYTSEGGIVTLDLSPETRGVIVKVTDTGHGISKEELPFIFDRFYRSQKANDDQTPSSGLGLAIAKRILELHGSSIEAHSTVEVGSTFIFFLPIHNTNEISPNSL